MLNWLPNAKSLRLLLLAAGLCLLLGQALEAQHDHPQLNADCVLCHFSGALACTDDSDAVQPPDALPWLETSPYHRLHRPYIKRGKRDPPEPAVAA